MTSSLLEREEVRGVPYSTPYSQTSGLTPFTTTVGLPSPSDSIGRYRLSVFAFDHSTGVSYWEFTILQRRVGSAAAAGLISSIVHSASSGGSTWTCVPAYNANGDLEATFVGALGATVDWFFIADDEQGIAGPMPT